MVKDVKGKTSDKKDLMEVHLDDRTIFFNELKRVCQDFGFEDVEFQIREEYGVPENTYKLTRSKDSNPEENVDNFFNIIDYMADFSEKNDLVEIMKTSFFTTH